MHTQNKLTYILISLSSNSLHPDKDFGCAFNASYMHIHDVSCMRTCIQPTTDY